MTDATPKPTEVRLHRGKPKDETEYWVKIWTCTICSCEDIFDDFNFCPRCGTPIKWVGKPKKER